MCTFLCRRKIREVHHRGELLCGVADHSLLIWTVSGELIATKSAAPNTTMCVSPAGRFYLASSGHIAVYRLSND